MAAADRSGLAGLRWLLLSLVAVALDQASKLHFLAAVPEFSRVPVIPGFFDWTLTYNEGVAFSLFGDGAGVQRALLTGFALVVSTGFAVWLTRLPRADRWSAAALALVIGGALGNAIDRIRLGHVVDFILVYWRDWYWPAFNVADSCIVVGAVVLVLAGFRAERD